MLQVCDVGKLLGNSKPYFCPSTPTRSQVWSFFGNSWESQGRQAAQCDVPGPVLGGEAFGELETTLLPEYASEVLGREPSWKLKAIILPEYGSERPGLASFGKLEAMVLPKYASEKRDAKLGYFWEPQRHNIARTCLQDVRLGSSWEARSHDIATVCLQDAMSGKC